MPDPINILVSLHRGYGLGDAIQMSPVLQHARKYRPHWRMSYRAEEGFHQVAEGICEHFAYESPTPNYDAEVLICLYEVFHGWTDRPNTRVTQALHECFDLPWDRECARYKINVSQDAITKAEAVVFGGIRRDRTRGKPDGIWHPHKQGRGVVLVHYQGDSAKHLKDLMHDQADRICQSVERLGYVPLILDWRNQCPLDDYRRLVSPAIWGRNAEMVTAIIAQCSAFIGIDSGPSKCASATKTPSLVIWTGHYPSIYHDPAPNTTHLIEDRCHNMPPVNGNKGVIDWLLANYQVQHWNYDPLPGVQEWLRKTLSSQH